MKKIANGKENPSPNLMNSFILNGNANLFAFKEQ
jgi:hypothetical protein